MVLTQFSFVTCVHRSVCSLLREVRVPQNRLWTSSHMLLSVSTVIPSDLFQSYTVYVVSKYNLITSWLLEQTFHGFTHLCAANVGHAGP